MLQGFKNFIMRGNVVDLAVGVVIGAAFGSVVEAIVADLLTPLIGAIAKTPDFSGLVFTINDSVFKYGHFINALLSFILIALAVYVFVVIPMTKMTAKLTKPGAPAAPTTKSCPECLGEIPLAARKCQHCTSSLM